MQFDRLAYMQMKSCENPECTCPEVAKLRKQAQDVIEKAKGSPINVQAIQRYTVPTGYIANETQIEIDVPDVLIVDIIVPKTNFRKRK